MSGFGQTLPDFVFRYGSQADTRTSVANTDVKRVAPATLISQKQKGPPDGGPFVQEKQR
jgi:hypothetical protein